MPNRIAPTPIAAAPGVKSSIPDLAVFQVAQDAKNTREAITVVSSSGQGPGRKADLSDTGSEPGQGGCLVGIPTALRSAIVDLLLPAGGRRRRRGRSHRSG